MQVLLLLFLMKGLIRFKMWDFLRYIFFKFVSFEIVEGPESNHTKLSSVPEGGTITLDLCNFSELTFNVNSNPVFYIPLSSIEHVGIVKESEEELQNYMTFFTFGTQLVSVMKYSFVINYDGGQQIVLKTGKFYTPLLLCVKSVICSAKYNPDFLIKLPQKRKKFFSVVVILILLFLLYCFVKAVSDVSFNDYTRQQIMQKLK